MTKIFIYGAVVLALGFAAVLYTSTPDIADVAVPLSNTSPTSTSEMKEAVSTSTTTPEVWECNGDARMCPDGSSVGRTGPMCEFQACPPADATFARVETYLGGRDGGLGLTINPREVISDSRCPEDVQCIWAGTVEVRATVETKVAHGEHVFKLGEPRIIGDLTVTLVEVQPNTKSDVEIPESSYWFVFEVQKTV